MFDKFSAYNSTLFMMILLNIAFPFQLLLVVVIPFLKAFPYFCHSVFDCRVKFSPFSRQIWQRSSFQKSKSWLFITPNSSGSRSGFGVAIRKFDGKFHQRCSSHTNGAVLKEWNFTKTLLQKLKYVDYLASKHVRSWVVRKGSIGHFSRRQCIFTISFALQMFSKKLNTVYKSR